MKLEKSFAYVDNDETKYDVYDMGWVQPSGLASWAVTETSLVQMRLEHIL